MAVDQAYERTTIIVVDKELWAWASYRARMLKLQYPWIRGVSYYIFELIKKDKEGKVIWD